MNVDPAEVESILEGHPAVKAAVVVGIPDPEWGERVVAVVVSSVPEEALEAELSQLCRSGLSSAKRPRAFKVLEQFPKTPMEKWTERRSGPFSGSHRPSFPYFSLSGRRLVFSLQTACRPVAVWLRRWNEEPSGRIPLAGDGPGSHGGSPGGVLQGVQDRLYRVRSDGLLAPCRHPPHHHGSGSPPEGGPLPHRVGWRWNRAYRGPLGKDPGTATPYQGEAAENLAGIRGQLEHFLDFEVNSNPARMVNNLDWLGELKMVDFLRDVGKHFSVNALLRKESIRRRLEEEEGGISFTEFSYALMQAYDFLVLNERYDCTVQMGGSDQWGNITAGIDLIRRMRGEKAFGLVFPLLTSASGAKFGKTEAGAVWLDPARTSPFRFYQFWLNTDDQDAVSHLKFFTLLSQEEVAELDQALQEKPHERAAQRARPRT